MAKEGITRETFETEAEAIAFISGIEFMDNDNVTTESYIEGREQPFDMWVVEVTVFA
jgi:hypothetical protein